MKNLLSILTLAMLLLIVCTTGWAQENFVTAKKLSLDDVKNAILTGSLLIRTPGGGNWSIPEIEPNSIKIRGIHQKDNTATIYCSFTVRGQNSSYNGKYNTNDKRSYVSLVRFDSGKWYSPMDDLFLTK